MAVSLLTSPCPLDHHGASLSLQATVLRWCWRIALVTLPITTLTFLGPPSSIRPPAAMIALVALPFVLVGDWRRLVVDRPLRWLLAAVGWAIMVGGFIVVCDPPVALPGKATATGLYVKAVMSLVLGLAVYFLARNQLRTFDDVSAALRWVLVGAFASAILAYAQVLSLATAPWLRDPIVALSSLFGAYDSAVPYVGRGHGMSGEPSYLASALCLSVVPFAVVVAMNPGRRSLILAAVALASAGLGCGTSGSRFGILGLAMIGTISLLCLAAAGHIRRAFVLAAVVSAAGVIGLVPLRGNAYISTPLREVKVADGLDGSLAKLLTAMIDPKYDRVVVPPAPVRLHSMVPRIAAATASIRIFQDYPVIGCGLGLSPLALPVRLPDWSMGWPEVRAWHDPAKASLATPMAMHLRIAAEGGLIGITLVLLIVFAHRPRYRHPAVLVLTVSGLAAVLVDGFTLASFALPGPWVLLAASQVAPSTEHA